MGVHRERWAASKAHRSFVQGLKTALQRIGGRVARLGKKKCCLPPVRARHWSKTSGIGVVVPQYISRLFRSRRPRSMNSRADERTVETRCRVFVPENFFALSGQRSRSGLKQAESEPRKCYPAWNGGP